MKNGGFSATLKGPAVYQEREVLGGSILLGWSWDGPRHRTNTKYGTTSRDILSLHHKACSQFNTRLSDQNRKSSRGARANGHAGDTRTSALGPSLVEPSSKKNILVTRDDGDESML